MKQLTLLSLVLISSAAFSQSTKMGDYNLDQQYKLDAKGTIYLTSSDAKVFITGSKRPTVHVKVERVVTTKGWVFGDESFAIDVTERDGNLSIKERSNSSHVGIVGYHYEKYTINIEAPEGASLVIKGDDGDYFINTVHGAVDLDLDDADVELTGCQGNDFRVRLDDGDLRMDTGKGTLEVDADDADVIIKNSSFSKISANLDDGDFVVETSLADAGDYFIDAQDGLVSLTVLGGGGRFDIRHDDARVVTEGNFSVVDKEEDRTRLTLASGNAKVDIRADDARVKLISRQ
jgi:hypothetical protein